MHRAAAWALSSAHSQSVAATWRGALSALPGSSSSAAAAAAAATHRTAGTASRAARFASTTKDASTDLHNDSTLPTEYYVKAAAERLQVDPGIMKGIITPDRELTVQLVMSMENGELEQFTGYRVQHNDALGPFKGGVIFHPDVNIQSMRNLASLNTYKAALLNLPFGGSKGGVAIDPRDLTDRELQRLSRKWVQALAEVLGPKTDIPSSDIGTAERHMAWMFDQYSKINGFSPACVTGKPLDLHGCHGRDTAGGKGVYVAAREMAIASLAPKIEHSTYVVQGFGKIGGSASQFLHEAGGKIIAVSSSETATFNEDGLDIPALREHAADQVSLIKDFPGGTPIANDAAFLEQPCDVLIPAAVAGTIDAAIAERLQCKAVIEAANGALTKEAEDVLQRRGIQVVPDLFAHGGSMVCSFFEWTQNIVNLKWEEEDVAFKLDAHMVKVFREILKTAREERLTLRQAAYNIALQRIVSSDMRKGFA